LQEFITLQPKLQLDRAGGRVTVAEGFAVEQNAGGFRRQRFNAVAHRKVRTIVYGWILILIFATLFPFFSCHAGKRTPIVINDDFATLNP
jgi:hypothetical protein